MQKSVRTVCAQAGQGAAACDLGPPMPGFEYSLLDQSPDGIVLTSLTGEVLFWSGGAERMFGIDAAQAIGRRVQQLIVPPEQAERHLQLQAVLLHGHATYEALRCCSDGSLLNVAVSSRLVELPEHDDKLILSTHTDISELRVERDARLAERRFRDLLECGPDGYVVTNETGRIVLVNHHAECLFGHEQRELLGQAIDVLVPERFRAAFEAHRAMHPQQAGARRTPAIELHGQRSDGSEFPLEISLSPLPTEHGVLVLSTIRDTSERKRIERALYEKNLELQAAAEANNRFLASMSHELRTPLNAIIGFTGTLMMRLPGPLTVDQEKQLATVQASARHLLSLINDLLDLARLDAGRLELQPEPVLLQPLVEEVVDGLRPLIGDKPLQLEVELPVEPLQIQIDRRALSQILINLAGNAIKYTERGSVRILLARLDDADTLPISLCIEDTGCGIPADQRHRLFQAFSRLESAASQRYEGSGLGLHLSLKLAELCGGTITLESEPGRGSTFCLRLPERAMPPRDAHAGSAGRAATVGHG